MYLYIISFKTHQQLKGMRMLVAAGDSGVACVHVQHLFNLKTPVSELIDDCEYTCLGELTNHTVEPGVLLVQS